jgi:hypothetical protein
MSEHEQNWPDAVAERLRAYGERTAKGVDEVSKDFQEYLQREYSIENWTDEDDDLILDLSEGFFVETRRQRGGGGTVSYVGHFVGAAGKVNDRRASMRDRVSKAYSNNPDEVIAAGDTGVYLARDGKWFLESKHGLKDTGQEVMEGQLPEHGFHFGDTILALLVKNPESKVYGQPFPCIANTRYYYFLGNTEDGLADEVCLLRVAAVGDNSQLEVRLGVPTRFRGRPIRDDAQPGWDDIVDTFDDWADTIEYTDEFVDPDLRDLFRAEKFWTSEDFHSCYTELDELADVYEARKEAMSDGDGYFGPIITTKGFVARMSTEPIQSDFDQTGRTYGIDITSMALQQAYGGDDRAEVRCWIPGSVHDLTHPFHFHDGAGWVEYAERSQVLVCGRISLRPSGGHHVPRLNVLGIFAIPNRARRRQSGGDTGLSQFN